MIATPRKESHMFFPKTPRGSVRHGHHLTVAEQDQLKALELVLFAAVADSGLTATSQPFSFAVVVCLQASWCGIVRQWVANSG